MRKVAAFLAMRPGEERLVAWMAALFISTQAGHGLGANTGDALFFVRFGVEFLPYMILASGGVVMVSMVAYGAGLARVGGRRFLPPLAWGLALVLAAERLAVGLDLAAVYALIWLTEQLVIMLTFMMMWNAAGEACDARQAKRLFPLFASAGIAGGMVGNLITGPLAVAIGTQNILLVHAGLLIGVGVLSAGVAARFFAPPQPAVSSSALSDLKAGYQVTRQSELLRLTAVTAAAFSALFFLVVFPFSEQVAASFGSEAQIAGFLGLFSGAATGLTFLVSLFVANRLFARIGVVATALLVPLVYLAGFGLWAVSFTLLTATIVRGAQWVAVNALGGTASSSLFNVVSPSRRGQVMAFVSGVPAQLGVMASGALLIAGSALTARQMALVGLLVAAASLVVVWRMRPAYGDALLEALRQGLVDVFTAPSPGLQKPAGDADAVRAIARALKDERPAVRRLAASLLGRLGGEAVVEPLLSAAGDDHPEVRATAFRALRALGSSQAPSLARTALHDPVALVRREAVMTLADNPEGRSSLEGCLADPDPPVRATAAAALRSDSARRVLTRMLRSGSAAEVEAALEAATDWQEVGTQAEVERLIAHPRPAIRLKAAGVMARHAPPGRSFTGRLLGLLEDPDHTVRVGMAETLRDHPALTGPLLGLLTQGSEQAQEGAVEALRGRTEAGPALLQWAAGQTERAESVRRYRSGLGTTDGPPSYRYLQRVLKQREWASLRRSLLALEAVAGPDAPHLLVRCARAQDQQLRAQALEALDAIADRRLTRRLVPLLEEEPEASPADVDRALRGLLDDPDEWLRALAARSAADRIGAEWAHLSERAGRDPSPLVKEAAGILSSGGDMAETFHPVGEPLGMMGLIDRVMVLQQVPMFSELDPEDLQRIAEMCEERSYGPEEVIYRVGEPGDEMLVVASGRVRVSKEVEGKRMVLRTFQPGEHVGELALLRRQPRAADVAADGVVVRGLAIRSAELQSILEERPEVAMAMLGTLAERLGTAI